MEVSNSVKLSLGHLTSLVLYVIERLLHLFQCAQCGKAFLELCDLKRHTKRHLLKSAKRVANQDSATNPPEASVESINLMVLTDSLIFTESQQLLDNPEPRPNQVRKYNDQVVFCIYVIFFCLEIVHHCIIFMFCS